MNVLIIAQYFPPDMGGGATRAYNIAKGLLMSGCGVTVVSAFPHYPTGKVPSEYRGKPMSVAYEGNMKVIRTFVPPLVSEGIVKRVFLFASFIVSSLLALPFAGKVDIVWAANPNILSIFPSMVYKIANRCKVVQNVDDLWPEALYDLGLDRKSLLAKIGERLAGFAYTFSSAITPISRAYSDVLLKKYGVDRSRIFVVPSGVDVDRFSRRKNFVARERFRVLYIGAFSPAYDFDQVLRAAEILSSSSANVDFVMQGGGELGRALEYRVETRNLHNVKIVNKIVSRDEVAEIMNDADALLLPLNGGGSIEMGISSKLYEYQAAGKPILCCSRGQPGQYVLASKSGLVVNPGDSEMLSKSIVTLIENPAACQELGVSGRDYVSKNLSVSQVGFMMKRVFQAVGLSRDDL